MEDNPDAVSGIKPKHIMAFNIKMPGERRALAKSAGVTAKPIESISIDRQIWTKQRELSTEPREGQERPTAEAEIVRKRG
mmetsp:Transcript_24361/g.45062  ORF Transcript_24361/g.45062 Transcript_24361/m.45062 type:complete len:80 (-) Transcript_24361:362-601(-)